MHHVRVNGATAAVPYVGRTEHRAAVRQAFTEPGHIVVVCGEAGVGKSALVAAERATATTEVVEGSCLTLAGQPLPLAALEQIFDARGGWPEVTDGSDEQSSEQRLKAVRRWADALAPTGSPAPLTLVVEDLHWADETTCDFLVYLASTAPRRGVSLVVTLRNDETPRVGRVQQAVAEISRLPGAENVELERLEPAEARQLVAALTGGADVDVDAWYAQSQGNPYLLGELVKDPGARRVKDVLLARVRALGADAAELVGLAAVFGLWVSDEDLFAASALAPDRYAAAVREAVDLGVLVVEGFDYAFRHSLMCEAVLNRLLPIERRLLHERAARALAASGADDVVTAASVSLHWSVGGDDRRGGRVEPARRPQGAVAQRLRRGVELLPAGSRPRPPAGQRGRGPRSGPRGRRYRAAGGRPGHRGHRAGAGPGSRIGHRPGPGLCPGAAGLLPLGGGPDRAQSVHVRRGGRGPRPGGDRRCMPRCGVRWRVGPSSWRSSTRPSGLPTRPWPRPASTAAGSSWPTR